MWHMEFSGYVRIPGVGPILRAHGLQTAYETGIACLIPLRALCRWDVIAGMRASQKHPGPARMVLI